MANDMGWWLVCRCYGIVHIMDVYYVSLMDYYRVPSWYLSAALVLQCIYLVFDWCLFILLVLVWLYVPEMICGMIMHCWPHEYEKTIYSSIIYDLWDPDVIQLGYAVCKLYIIECLLLVLYWSQLVLHCKLRLGPCCSSIYSKIF